MRKLAVLAAIAVAALSFGTHSMPAPASAGGLPPGGLDIFDVSGEAMLDLSPIGFGTEVVPLLGTMSMDRGNPVGSTIPIEIVEMSLTGNSSLLGPNTPLLISLNPNAPPSLGQIGPVPPGFPNPKADSFFDIQFVDIKIGPFQHFAGDPIHMKSQLNSIPPHSAKYDSGIKENPIIDNKNPTRVVGFLNHLSIQIGPPQKLPSITVLKIDAASHQPLPGWEMHLYTGFGCLGNPLASGFTDADGFIDFLDLAPDIYSVKEKLQPDWESKNGDCQDVLLPGGVVTSLGLPACPTQPDLEFPEPGCDSFDSGAQVNIAINSTEEIVTVTLNGPTQIERGPVLPGMFDQIQTEIVEMELSGTSLLGPIFVYESPTLDSTGLIEEQTNSTPGTLEFPADSFFDIFFEIDLPDLGMTLHNNDPFHIECKIDEIPPVLCIYQPPVTDPIVLYNADQVKIATIVHGLHIPLPPNEVLVVFENNIVKPEGDKDGDGCSNAREKGPIATLGGQRDANDFWDFFDPTLDGAISILDFFALLERFGSGGDSSIDPLTAPPPAPGYHTRFDRGPQIGANGWNVAPPDGAVAITDFFTLLSQFGHSCL